MEPNPGKVLVVEDEAPDRLLIKEVLSADGLTLITAEDGEAALAALAERLPDLAIVDIMLPKGIDGFELTRRLKSDPRTRHIPVMIVTALSDRESRLQALELGAEEFLCKPVDRAELLARVRTMLKLKEYQDFLADHNRLLEEQVRERTTALKESEEQFRGLVEQSIAGTYLIQDGKFAYVNPRFAEILGYGAPGALMVNGASSQAVGRDYHALVGEIRRRVEGERKPVSFELTAQRADGSSVDLGLHGTQATHRGRPAIIGLMQDISLRKRAEEQIQSYMAQLESALMSTVQVATTLGEMRDPYTAGHQRRVGEVAVAIGAELGFDLRRQEGLRVAGYLHDVGKISIPSEILTRPGKLSPIELQFIHSHARSGYEVLKSVSFPWPVAEVALQHHERMDGSGYPQGLKGEAILLEARIMAVADVIEAMSSHRPYRAARGLDKALAEIERGRGTAYDPAVVDVCLKLFREKGYVIPT